jgi:hypothetical protein
MNATERIEAAGIDFKVGQTITIPSFPSFIHHVLENGEYVILDGETLEVVDVAFGHEAAETYANEIDGTTAGHIAVQVTHDGNEVQQYWRDIVADCWGFQN